MMQALQHAILLAALRQFSANNRQKHFLGFLCQGNMPITPAVIDSNRTSQNNLVF